MEESRLVLTQRYLGHGGMPNLSTDPRVMLAMSKYMLSASFLFLVC